jgi:hypothetical protein
MKISRLLPTAFTVVAIGSLSVVAGRTLVFAAPQAPPPEAAQAAQATPPGPLPGSMPGPPHEHPAPTNLKVLPRNLTGQQVHEIMEQWEGALGTRCKTCHAADPKRMGPDGKPALNYADDSKEDKQTARKMFKMVEEINANYISKIDSSGDPVTCGTCHRGHLGPEPFAAPARPH